MADRTDTARGSNSGRRTDREQPERAIVLGLAGVSWRRLRKFAASGELPAVARLFTCGASGRLESTLPAATPLAWPTITTGTWPDQHEIYGFRRFVETDGCRINTSGQIQQPTLWELVSPAVVANVPLTYPADSIEGEIVAGMLTPEREDGFDEGFTSPPSVAGEIEQRLPNDKQQLSDDVTSLTRDGDADCDRSEPVRRDLRSIVTARQALFDLLLRRTDWRLAVFAFTAPDRYHRFGRSGCSDRSSRPPNAPPELYRRIDESIAEFMAIAERNNATLFVVSEAGIEPAKRKVNVNRLLADAQYLGLDGENNEHGVVREYLSEVIGGSPAQSSDGGQNGSQISDIEYTSTSAFATGLGTVYVNDTDRFATGTVESENVDQIKATVASTLTDARDPVTGERPLTVYDGMELFARDRNAPDLVVDADRYGIDSTLADDPFDEAEPPIVARQRSGVLFAWGSTISAGERISGASVVDVLPTVVHALGDPVPRATDGRVLDQLFTSGTSPATRSVAYRNRDSRRERARRDSGCRSINSEAVRARLEKLGYANYCRNEDGDQST